MNTTYRLNNKVRCGLLRFFSFRFVVVLVTLVSLSNGRTFRYKPVRLLLTKVVKVINQGYTTKEFFTALLLPRDLTSYFGQGSICH